MSTGPDLHHFIMGSEGKFFVKDSQTLKIELEFLIVQQRCKIYFTDLVTC